MWCFLGISIVHFLLLNNILLYEYATLCLFFPLLVDIGVSICWLLMNKSLKFSIVIQALLRYIHFCSKMYIWEWHYWVVGWAYVQLY